MSQIETEIKKIYMPEFNDDITINKDLETFRYNKFMNEEINEGAEENDNEKTEDDLSPQKYDSYSKEELNKIYINQMDYFANLMILILKKIIINKKLINF